MITEHGIVGSLHITGSFTLHGIAEGHITVASGGTIRLHGIAASGLTVDAGGEAVVHGIVQRGVMNAGRFALHGIVVGGISTAPGGLTQISAKSIIDGVEQAGSIVDRG